VIKDVLTEIANTPALALLGGVVVMATLLAPAALALAGLTGAQIIDLLKSTMQFVIELIKAFRDENKNDKTGS
jgi:hypothetical protein